MALVASTGGIPQHMDRIRCPEVDLTGLNMKGSSEIVVVEPSLARTSSNPSSFAPSSPDVTVDDEATFVALGKEEKEAESTLRWVLQKPRGKIFILHVHQAAQKISIMGANVPIGRLEECRVREYHEAERQDMHKILDKYISICQKAGVQAEKCYIEMDSIEKGIVELISLHGIRKLVMGAAANRQYSRYYKSNNNTQMLEPKSRKAIYVRLKAPDFCHIWFVCKSKLIHTRESTSNGVNMEVISPVIQSSPRVETDQFNSRRSKSVTEGLNGQIRSTVSSPDYCRITSDNHGIRFSAPSALDRMGGVTPHSRLGVEGSTDGLDWTSISSPMDSHFSSRSSTEMVEGSTSDSVTRLEGSGEVLESHLQHHSCEDHCYTSHSPQVIGGNMDDELYDRLQQYVEEAEISRREAYEESIRHRKAEKEAIKARCRAKASESKYSEELRQRKEIEESLARGKEEVDQMKSRLDEIKEKLQVALEQKSSLECQIEISDKTVQELEQKMFSAVELLQNYKNERDELHMERDNALREAEELRKIQVEETSSSSASCLFSEYSFSELEEATRNFDPALKIGKGGYGSIYKGLLCHTQVAIKMLHPESSQGPLEFQQEVNILSKLRHPNLVTLIGACPEAWALIYEYLPNGSLEDRLSCKDNSPPLSWQTRIRIAAELCSALVFLHSCSPRCIVHGDLKPANILLDANYVSKLSDFGICRVLSEDEFSDSNTSLCCGTGPKGTFAYMDPEFLATGELTPKSDVYSFGIILLRLLTGKSALGITKEVQYAVDKGNLKDILDPTAGDWPFVQAKQLAHLAMSCCEISQTNRPDLASEVWKVLEPMRASCGASSSRLNSGQQSHVPPYFICPIFQEIMQDPVVAADGFTYEAEAVKGWLDAGHDASPMTNVELAHRNLVPNHALRSAIQEWLQES